MLAGHPASTTPLQLMNGTIHANTHYIVFFRRSKSYSMNFLKFEVVSVGN